MSEVEVNSGENLSYQECQPRMLYSFFDLIIPSLLSVCLCISKHNYLVKKIFIIYKENHIITK